MRRDLFIAAAMASILAAPVCAQASEGVVDVNVSTFGNAGLDLSGFSLSTDLDGLASANGMDGFGEGLDMSLDIDSTLDTAAADDFFKTTFGDSYEGITSNLTSVSMPEGINFESLNTQYANLQVDYANSKKELDTDVEMPCFDGYSGDSTEAFKAVFGDLADSLKISSYSIPSDFDVNAMLSQSIEERESALSSVRDSAAFEAVSNNLSYGSVFSKAQEGVSMDELNAKIDALGMDNISSVMSDVSSMVSGRDQENLEAFNDVASDRRGSYDGASSSLADSYSSNVSSLPDASSAAAGNTGSLSNGTDRIADSNKQNYNDFNSDNQVSEKIEKGQNSSVIEKLFK